MAIEIPALQTDRLSRPDWGTAAALGRYQLAADRLLSALETQAVPIALLGALRGLAAARATVDVFVAADRGLVQLVVDGRRITLTGTARDAVLTVLGQQAGSAWERSTGAGIAVAASHGLDPSAAARAASVDVEVEEARLHAGIPADASALEGGARRPATVIPAPLIAQATVEDAARILARAVESSGLFLEAHLAQWMRGERSLRQIQEEVHQLPVDTQAADAEVSEQRGARQLEALQQQSVALTGQAWAGQPVQIEIASERERHREAVNVGDATGVFVATLTLRLPSLGPLRARVRVMDTTVGVQFESERPGALAADLPLLADALAARGLRLAQLAAVAFDAGDH